MGRPVCASSTRPAIVETGNGVGEGVGVGVGIGVGVTIGVGLGVGVGNPGMGGVGLGVGCVVMLMLRGLTSPQPARLKANNIKDATRQNAQDVFIGYPSSPGTQNVLVKRDVAGPSWVGRGITGAKPYTACPAAYPEAQAQWKLKPPSWPVTSTTSPIK